MTEEQKELFEKDPFIKMILETDKKVPTIRLIGGAVADILEGRKPKDYDITTNNEIFLLETGFKFIFETSTAKTFKKEDISVQILKTAKEDFDFQIACSELTIDYLKKLSLVIDEISFKNKVLIPNQKSFTNKKNALNSLRRIPHWRNKGYVIADETYLSLLSIIGKSNGQNS